MKILGYRLSMLAMSVGGASLIVLSGASTASAVVVSVFYGVGGISNEKQNDCSGYFGQPFNNCNIFFEDSSGTRTTLSPVIAKYDNDANAITAVNDLHFPSIDGSEFIVDETNMTWSYSPTLLDPLIKYWVLKQSSGFTLFWEVEDASACGTSYSLECMQAAIAISSGSWTGDFSHLTWYDSIPPNGGSGVIPLPGGIVLLLSAIGGLGVVSRLRASKSA